MWWFCSFQLAFWLLTLLRGNRMSLFAVPFRVIHSPTLLTPRPIISLLRCTGTVRDCAISERPLENMAFCPKSIQMVRYHRNGDCDNVDIGNGTLQPPNTFKWVIVLFGGRLVFQKIIWTWSRVLLGCLSPLIGRCYWHGIRINTSRYAQIHTRYPKYDRLLPMKKFYNAFETICHRISVNFTPLFLVRLPFSPETVFLLCATLTQSYLYPIFMTSFITCSYFILYSVLSL